MVLRVPSFLVVLEDLVVQVVPAVLVVRHYLEVLDSQLVLVGRMALDHPEVLENRKVLEVLMVQEVETCPEEALVVEMVLAEPNEVTHLVSQVS